jgi:intracellular septation protein A
MRTVFEIPNLRSLARHAVPHLLEATIAPLLLFYAAMAVFGVWGALGVALAWSCGALLRRVIRRERIPGILVMGTLMLTIRTIIAVLSGSVLVYFLQPTLGTVALAAAFLLSVPAGKPLTERLAADFLPMDLDHGAHPHLRQIFSRLSLLWSLVYFVNAAATIWLLLSQPLATYLAVKTVGSLVLTGSAIGISTLWFRYAMRRHGVEVRFAPAATPAVAAA